MGLRTMPRAPVDALLVGGRAASTHGAPDVAGLKSLIVNLRDLMLAGQVGPVLVRTLCASTERLCIQGTESRA